MAQLAQVIRFTAASIEFTASGCRTTFDDGSYADSIPHETPHYYVVSHRTGYGDDIMAYCREHDVCHLFVAERITKQPSLLFRVAHRAPVFAGAAASEEALVQTFQRWLRANEEPIIADQPWRELKEDALRMLCV